MRANLRVECLRSARRVDVFVHQRAADAARFVFAAHALNLGCVGVRDRAIGRDKEDDARARARGKRSQIVTAEITQPQVSCLAARAEYRDGTEGKNGDPDESTHAHGNNAPSSVDVLGMLLSIIEVCLSTTREAPNAETL